MVDEDVLSTAEAYIHEYGDALQRARVAALLHAGPPTAEALAQWRLGRQHDGGWASSQILSDPPAPIRGRSNLIATMRALRYGHELGLGVTPEVRGALLWLTRQQRPDGAFVDLLPVVSDQLDAQRLGAVDDWMMMVWATASALHALDEWIAAVPAYRDARRYAYEWLRSRVADWAAQSSRAIWLVTAAALTREGVESPLVLKLIALLTLRLGDANCPLSARDLADLATALTLAGWPASESPVSCAMTSLGRMRRDDGAFADPRGREEIAETTIAAIRAYLATGATVPCA